MRRDEHGRKKYNERFSRSMANALLTHILFLLPEENLVHILWSKE